jgi:glycosidase
LVKVKPDILLLAEASKPDLLVKAFDADYSWPLHGTLNKVLLGGGPASEFKKSWDESRQQFPRGSLHMRITDNHDEARAVARFSIKGALAASVLMFTLDGVPLLYNGMEVGDATESGDPALFEKLPVFWHPKERPPLPEIYKGLIKMRKQYPSFRSDEVAWLHNSDETNLVTFTRSDAADEFLIAINFSNRPLSGSVETPHAAEFKLFKFPGMADANAALPALKLNGFDWRIFHRTVGK